MENYKFFNDTLMEWDKYKKRYSWSMKRIFAAILFPYSLVLGWKTSFGTPTVHAVEIFSAIFVFIGYVLGVNLLSYLKNSKEDEQTINNNNNQQNTVE